MASILRFRKLCYLEPLGFHSFDATSKKNKIVKDEGGVVVEELSKRKQRKKQGKECKVWDWSCRMIGYMCTIWWILLVLHHSFPVTLTGLLQGPEMPGSKLKKEGLTALHPVVLVPGIVTGGLELWEGRPCAEALFRKRIWGGTFSEFFRRPLCWLEHITLDKETGLDPPGIRVRAVPGLVAADYFATGYFVWAVLIENLAKIGYDGKNLYMNAYDWRLSFQNTEVRDLALSRLKSRIELMYVNNGNKKVVVLPHSMGALYFLHFLKWVEAPPPMGGGGGPGWCAKHIKAIMNIGPAYLGVSRAVGNMISGEAKDIAFARAMAPGFLHTDLLGLQTLERVMRVSQTWDSIVSLLPKGGEAVWGNLDWSPEEGYPCETLRKNFLKGTLKNQSHATNASEGNLHFRVDDPIRFGRIISFRKEASQMPSSKLQITDFKELSQRLASHKREPSCGEVWTEYDEMSRESIQEVSENKAYTAQSLFDLLRFIAPKTMKRAEAHFSNGIADNLDDPKYSHYKYWSNPLETKLPDAPDMEIYCLYGVGIPTERSYVYKSTPSNKCKSTPFRIDSSVNGKAGECLKHGVYLVDGDGSVPVLSAGYMCAKGWRGKTRFNPSGSPTHVREYRHKPPASLLEGRGFESGSHVDILGNIALIEDIMRVAAGEELAGDRIYSDLLRMSDRINVQL